jgi:hypothetical protein
MVTLHHLCICYFLTPFSRIRHGEKREKEGTMGVLSERIFAVFLALSGTSRRTPAALETTEAQAVPKEWPTPTPTRMTGCAECPSSSVLRADLEAMRSISRVR